jgi:cellulose synthase/poly-beta-1,6-N-acetylglucosamine synthase-like glycosyltransferase
VSHWSDLLAGYLAPVLAGGVVGALHLFWFFVVVEGPRHLLFDALVLVRRWRERPVRDRPCRLEYCVVMPVLNEERTLEASVRSLESQSHAPTRIVLVNDGSTDGTPHVGRRLAARSDRIVFIEQGERGGKSAALNRGLHHVTSEVVVFVDSDTTFDRDAMRNLVRRLERPGVVAAGGVLRVRNRRVNLLTEVQALEYGLVITLMRQGKAELGILPIVSGAFGAFRTARVRAVGGHDPGPGNDSDLTIKMRRSGGLVDFAHDAVCHTNVPESLGGFVRQRLRWSRNVVKNRVRKHSALFSPLEPGFSLRNLLSTADPVAFQCVLSWIWIGYVAWASTLYTEILPGILLGNWLLYLGSGLLRQLLVVALSERPREDLQGLLFLPLYHPFRVFHRGVMLFAQAQELFTRASIRDPFAPAKVRRAQPDW